MAVGIFVQRLRVTDISEERIKPIKPSDLRVIIPRAEIVEAAHGVELFAAIQVLRESLRRVEADGVAIRIIIVALQDLCVWIR